MRRTTYTVAAPFYDLLAGEPVYRAGRVAGIAMLHLRPGDVVVDLGCGTGLSLARLAAAVGPTGLVVGIDASPQMLRVAGRRIERHRLTNVQLVQADATTLTAGDLPARRVDAVIATYSMSVMGDPSAAWARLRSTLRTRGADRPRICIVDMQRPTGWASVLAPLARGACALGGADIDAHPWQHLERATDDSTRMSLRGGHIQVVAATLRDAPGPGRPL